MVCVVSAIVLSAGTHSQALFVLGILVAAGLLGLMVVLPIGGADMPVVISLLNAFTGLSAAATGIALNNTALIVAGMIVGASGTILTNLMAKAMTVGPGDHRGRVRWGHRRSRRSRDRRGDRPLDVRARAISARDRASSSAASSRSRRVLANQGA